MRRVLAKTSLVVHATDIDTIAKRGDLILQMQRKFEGRFGRTTPIDVQHRLVRRACCFRSAAYAYLFTLELLEGDPWHPIPSDGHLTIHKEYYAEQERLRKERIQKIMQNRL